MIFDIKEIDNIVKEICSDFKKYYLEKIDKRDYPKANSIYMWLDFLQYYLDEIDDLELEKNYTEKENKNGTGAFF